MSISYCGGVPVKEQIEDKEMRNMRKLFNGEATVDIDGKSIKIGDTITRSYGKTTGASDPSMAERLFKEIVVNETYKHAIDEYVGFTEGDYRRIRNRIIKESKKLGNPKLGILEKLFFVKRGVMGKFAVTNWMNKNINLVTNYERTKYGEYLRGNIRISRLLRAEALKRGQPRWIPGIKNEKDLRKLENKLIREMSNPESEINFDKVNKIKRKILGVLGEQGDGVMADLRDYLQTPKEEIYEVLREKPDKFSKNIVEAGEITRKLLDSMGHVLIKGLRSFKETQSLAYLNVPNTKVGTIGAAVNAKLAKKLQRNFLKIDEEIKAIEEGMKDGNYFPHYLTGAFVKLEGIMDKALASKDPAKRAGEYMDEIENVFRNMRNNTGVPSSAKFKGT
ncbi:hypothetical protein CMI37_25440, partial [Candidatus Pacearchaeota archaeon]|nr:hypothetical protein [Candidatus Pacearchaeota archaeon]